MSEPCPNCGWPFAPPRPRCIGNLVVDRARGVARTRDGMVLALTPTEYRLLAALADQTGAVVPYHALSGVLRTEPMGPGDAKDRLKVHVGRLRAALAAAGLPGVIQTVRELGYVLDTEDGAA